MKEKLFKKGITRRLLSVVLGMVMVVTLLPMNKVVVYAEGTLPTELNGYNVTWSDNNWIAKISGIYCIHAEETTGGVISDNGNLTNIVNEQGNRVSNVSELTSGTYYGRTNRNKTNCGCTFTLTVADHDWEESTTVDFEANDEVISTFDSADYDTDEEFAAAIYEYASVTTPEKTGNIFRGWYVYALDKNGDTLEEDMLTETGLDGYGTYADFIEETEADKVVVMPKWRAVGTLVQDITDDKGIYTPKAFGLNGLQIRKDNTVDTFDSTIQYGGLRFVSSKSVSFDSFTDYGYVVAREDDAVLFQEHYNADADKYKIKYNKGNDVERTAETDYRYVTNVSMAGTINHRDFNDYSLFTFVIDYEGAEGLKNTNFIVRSYAKYEDDYGIERIYYDDYDGASVQFGGVCTSYNAVNAIA